MKKHILPLTIVFFISAIIGYIGLNLFLDMILGGDFFGSIFNF